MTHRQSAGYDWRCQAFIGLKGTCGDASYCVHDHIPSYSGLKKYIEINSMLKHYLHCKIKCYVEHTSLNSCAYGDIFNGSSLKHIKCVL